MASDEYDEYDEYDAKIRVPKGARLAASRKTAGAHRGFAHGTGDKKIEHAEIFLTDKSDTDSQPDPPPVFVYDENFYVPDSRERDSREPDSQETEEIDFEALGELLVLLVVLGVKVAPQLKRWWNEPVLPFVRSVRYRLGRKRKVDRRHAPPESAPLVTPAPGKSSPRAAAAFARRRATMSSEARERFTSALVAKLRSEDAQRFSAKQLSVLRKARIEDPELRRTVETLRPAQVANRVKLMLEANPELLDELGGMLRESRGEGGYPQLRNEILVEARRLTDGEV